MPQGAFSQLLMVSDSFLATSASNVVAFASDRNQKCHIICPCVMKSAWQLTSRPVTEGPEAPANGLWLCRGLYTACTLLHGCDILMHKSTPCNFPGSDERRAGQSHSFLYLTDVTLWAQALRLSEDRRGVCLAVINWQCLALCFWTLDSKVPVIFFSVLSQISLKALKITEADSVPDCKKQRNSTPQKDTSLPTPGF